MNILKRIFGSSNARKLKKMKRNVKAINELEKPLLLLTDDQLGNKTHEFKERHKQGEALERPAKEVETKADQKIHLKEGVQSVPWYAPRAYMRACAW